MKKFYYIKDNLSSTRSVINENGNIVESYDYYPFGLKLPVRTFVSGTPSRNLFTGKELDSETGWNYHGGRYYWLAGGRWWSVDPHDDNYHSVSPYVYVGNNPIGFIDPTGMDSTDTQNTNNQNNNGIPESDFVYINGQKLHRKIAKHLYGSNYTSITSTGGDGNGTGENQNTQSQESNSNSHNFLYWTSNSLTATGTITTSIELSKLKHGMWKGANGKWYPLSWGGNQYAGSRSMVYRSANVWKIAGRTVFVAGAIVSVYQGVSALKSGNYASAIESGLDITMGAVGTFGGPIGLGVSVVYFGIDATIGWENAAKNLQSMQRIWGPSLR